jgi:segregation and condensation protein A
MSYKIKLDVFEGPFDLLVYLIENARMSVYDIQVSEITNQYLDYLEHMQGLDVNIATEFMVLAAALIELKSKMLLPRMKPEGDGLIEEDPRIELVQKILEYKRFKAAAELLEHQEEQTRRIFIKPKEDLAVYTKETDEYLNLDLSQFVKAFHLFLQKKTKDHNRIQNRIYQGAFLP